MNYSYNFAAIKGQQARREYYIAMVPLKLLSKLFPISDVLVLPEFRAQRKINESRIPEIRNYILDNRNTYVFSALAASIDGNYKFISNDINGDIGLLQIDLDSVLLINDGQHRCAAIQEALEEESELANETISIVFYGDRGLKNSQQMFTDLNKHAVKTSNSLSTLYDSRDELAVATKIMIEQIPFFNLYTDREKDNLGKHSSNLFTLNNIYKANKRIFRGQTYKAIDFDFLLNYWISVVENMVEWNELMDKAIKKRDLKENYIATLGVTIQAFGRLGFHFRTHVDGNMYISLAKLRKINWLRRNSRDWMGRTLRQDGKVLSNEEAILLTCNKIKQLIEINLDKDEVYREEHLFGGKYES